MKNIACLVLAAGQGKRFGGLKQLAYINNNPMIKKILLELKDIFKNHLFIVLGASQSRISPIIDDLAIPVINDLWINGMGSSISVGVKKIKKKNYDGVLIVLGDQVGIKKNQFEKLIYHFNGNQIVASKYSDKYGVPAIFPNLYFNELECLSGESGARSILNSKNYKILGIEIEGNAIDIDTPDDLKKFMESN